MLPQNQEVTIGAVDHLVQLMDARVVELRPYAAYVWMLMVLLSLLGIFWMLRRPIATHHNQEER